MTVFARILVTLDGSPFSEQALELAHAIQSQGKPDYSLLRVVTSADALNSKQDPKELLEEARKYLEQIGATRLASATTKILAKQADDPAEQILEEAEGHDLVVVMTHGRGGLKRWVWGSVAERVVRHCSVPVLLGNAKADPASRAAIKKILVPLDGSERASSVLKMVGRLARGLAAEVVLFRAAWVDLTDNASAYARETDAIREAIKAELEGLAESLRSDGVQVTSQVVLDYPAEAILKAVEATGSDLIAMTTHGRTGLKRWLLGSVAEKVLRAGARPVLLVRVPSDQLG